MATQEIASRGINDADLAGIKSFDDALALLTELGATPVKVSDYGTGFNVIDDKNALVGVPFIILSMFQREGDYAGDGYVSIEVVTKHGDKYVVNDGSTGIAKQIRGIVAAREADGVPNPDAGIYVEHGLTRSDYYRNEITGEIKSKRPDGAGKEWVPGTTFYLS